MKCKVRIEADKTSAVITDPNDPKFDLEAYLQIKEADSV